MNFDFMSESIGKTVRLERGGPDKLVGKLVAIMPDAIALETQNEGVVYVNSRHVKTISESVIPEVQISTAAPVDGAYPVLEEEEQPPLLEAENFQDLLGKLKHRLIRINHGGPNSLQGVLIEIRPEAVTILHEMKDYVHYPVYHIKSVTWILNPPENKEQDQKNNEAKDNGKEKSNDKAKGNDKGEGNEKAEGNDKK
jgi:ribosome maturation factor RimP